MCLVCAFSVRCTQAIIAQAQQRKTEPLPGTPNSDLPPRAVCSAWYNRAVCSWYKCGVVLGTNATMPGTNATISGTNAASGTAYLVLTPRVWWYQSRSRCPMRTMTIEWLTVDTCCCVHYITNSLSLAIALLPAFGGAREQAREGGTEGDGGGGRECAGSKQQEGESEKEREKESSSIEWLTAIGADSFHRVGLAEEAIAPPFLIGAHLASAPENAQQQARDNAVQSEVKTNYEEGRLSL